MRARPPDAGTVHELRILYVALAIGGLSPGTGKLAPFQQADLDFLRELGHDVLTVLWKPRDSLRVLRGGRWADLVYCWNISDHAFVASFTARRLACVIGGFEFASIPECNYGNMSRWRTRLVTKRVWRRADALLYVDPSLAEEATRAFGHPGKQYDLPTAYDSDFWTPDSGERKDIVLTVCNAPTIERWKLKGIDLFLEAARLNPSLEFHIVGEVPRFTSEYTLAPNVKTHGFLSPVELRDLYRRAKAYCQFSLHEGLPNAVCEAMLCGCVPVGSAVNGIPTAIGQAGFVVDRTIDAINEGIHRALGSEHLRGAARDRVATMFPLERRKNGLAKILEKVSPHER